MTPDQLSAQPRTIALSRTILRLSLISHVKGVSYDSSGGGGGAHAVSGAEPPGGVDRRGDRVQPYRQKSHVYFSRRLEGLYRNMSRMRDHEVEAIRDELLREALSCLRDWMRTPSVPGRDPDWGTFEWKCRIANDPRSSRVVAAAYGISHVTVLRYRDQYRGIR